MNSHDTYALRAMRQSDLKKVLDWRNSYRIRREMYSEHIISWEEHQNWFDRVTDTGTSLHFVFEISGRPVGVVNVTDIDRTHNRCHWGFYIGEPDAPRGSGTIMGYRALALLLEDLGFYRVIGEAICTNTASIKYHKRLGFIEEGRLIGHAFKGGYYRDVIAMAITRDHWENIKPELYYKYFDREPAR